MDAPDPEVSRQALHVLCGLAWPRETQPVIPKKDLKAVRGGGSEERGRVLWFAADRRHHTCLHDAGSTAGLSRRPAKYRAKNKN